MRRRDQRKTKQKRVSKTKQSPSSSSGNTTNAILSKSKSTSKSESNAISVVEEKDPFNDNDHAHGEHTHQHANNDEEPEAHFTSEYYFGLRKGSKISKSSFKEIDCVTEDEIHSLKAHVIQHGSNQKLKQQLLPLYSQQFNGWRKQLKCGFNLLFYGCGSKKHILEQFGTQCLTDARLIIINGYSELVTIKQVLVIIVDEMTKKNQKKIATKKHTGVSSTATNNDRQTALNITAFIDTHLYLVINNLDGKCFRSKFVQEIVCILANCAHIHLCASIDHIHAFLLWDRNMLSKLHWIYHEISTYAHYYKECEFDLPTIPAKTENRRQRAIKHVLESLTPNHRDILELLARKQLDGGRGYAMKAWYEEAYAAMLVANELKFQEMVGELTDHHLVQFSGGTQIFEIPHSLQIIQEQIIDFVG